MAGVILLGAGGHAKVVADILRCQGGEVAGYLDDNPATWGTHPLDIPVLGPTARYSEYAAEGLIIAIGSNAIRQRLAAELGAAAPWCNAIHPRATVAASVRLGIGVVVAAGAVINPDCVIGDHVIINTGATMDHECSIASFCHIAPGVHLAGGVQVGEGTLMGIGAVVIPGRKIGCHVTIGAGAVVVDDIPDGVTVKGVPAR